jgi:hypothetical protein
MAVRQSVVLREQGCRASVADFRRVLAEIKSAHFPDLSDEELTYTREEADTYCDLVRRRIGAEEMSRPFILRSLIGLRKHPIKA